MASIPRAMPLRIIRPRAARSPGAYDAEAGHVEDLRIAAQIEKNRRIVNLQQGLGIFWLCPVYETAAGNIADACQLLFRAFEGILIMDGLRNARWQAAR